MIEICDAQGKSLMLAPATNSMTSSQMEVFSCDLNRDNLPDFIVNVWSGGTGLATVGTEVTLLLSSKAGYRAASIYLYSFGEEDLVQFKAGGPVYFILDDLISSNDEKTRDGREHNFWVYELYRIDRTIHVHQQDRPLWQPPEQNRLAAWLRFGNRKKALLQQLGREAAPPVRLGWSVHRRVEVPLWRSLPPVTESNCAVATRGGEQLEVNG
jgi:hypothetical protein